MDKEKEDYFCEVVRNTTLMRMKKCIKANEDLGVTQKYIRKNYDNDSAKKAFKNETFNGRKTIKDPITGEILHYNTSKAKIKYKAQSGSKKWAKHAPETDHIIPLEQGHKVLKNNPFLSDEDLKRIFNDKSNFRITSKRYNTRKQAKSDVEMAFSDKEMTIGGRVTAVSEQSKATVGAAVNATAITAKNVTKEFSAGAVNALEASAIPIMIEGVHNLYLVANGDKKFEDAAKDMGKLTANIASSGGEKAVTTIIKNTLANSENALLKEIANSNQIAQIITVALIVKDSTIKYINGEIGGEEFFREIGDEGIGVMAGMIGAEIGQALIPIPVVGAIIGSMIISTACTEIYRIYLSLNEHKEKLKKVSFIASEALSEMERQRNVLKHMIGEQFVQWDKQFDLGFDKIFKATLNNDVNGIATGLNEILAVFGESVKFKTFKEFEQFFMDKDSVFTL